MIQNWRNQNEPPFRPGQSVMWLRKDAQGKVRAIAAKVANTVEGKLILRVVQQSIGTVYFKAVPINEVQSISSSVMFPSGSFCPSKSDDCIID